MSLGQPDYPSPRLRGAARVAAVVSGYHAEVTGAMFDSAREALIEAGAEDVLRVEAPGSFELPLLAQAIAGREDVDAVLCFGLILKGETEHDTHIARAVSQGLMRVALDTRKPVLFGVLTCSTLEQAQARARCAADGGLDKGREVARAAVIALNALAQSRESLSPMEETR